MIKIIKALFLTILLNTNSFSSSTECKMLYRKFDLDIEIKSPRGWVRVCNNHKLYRYVYINLSYSDIESLCKCFKEELRDSKRDRSISNKPW